MILFRGRMFWLAAGCVLSLPAVLPAQPPQAARAAVPQREVQPVAEWSKQLIETANNCWSEGKPSVRDKQLLAMAEQTPAQLAYVTRILQQNDAQQSAKVISTLKEYFGIIRRVGWEPGDVPHMQRVVASWSVMAPQLVNAISLPDLSANQRRILESALVDLASISRDKQLGSPQARQTWQSLVLTVGKLASHPKTSVRLVALSVLEAIGTDALAASPSVQQCLNDADRFVRWSAIRTLQAIGLDQTGQQAIARLQKDDDAQVRQAACLACTSPLSPPTVVTDSRPRLELPKPDDVKAPSPSILAEAEKKPLPLPKPVEKVVVAPPSKPVEAPPVLKDLPLIEPVKPLPVVAKPTSAQPTAPSPLSPSLPVVPLPASKPMPEPVPLFSPPTTSEPKAKPAEKIQPVAAVQPVKAEARLNPVNLWLPGLRHGSVGQQIQSVRQLGKLGAGASDAVPALAEALLKADVSVRREIPMTLAQIGAPAKMATAVLERCLQDRDTEVKVNAARALLELADK